jgi:hypothetical protein
MSGPEISTESEAVPCPHCGLEVRLWTSRPDWQRRGLVTVQALSHALPACPGFRETDDSQAFVDLAVKSREI